MSSGTTTPALMLILTAWAAPEIPVFCTPCLQASGASRPSKLAAWQMQGRLVVVRPLRLRLTSTVWQWTTAGGAAQTCGQRQNARSCTIVHKKEGNGGLGQESQLRSHSLSQHSRGHTSGQGPTQRTRGPTGPASVMSAARAGCLPDCGALSGSGPPLAAACGREGVGRAVRGRTHRSRAWGSCRPTPPRAAGCRR